MPSVTVNGEVHDAPRLDRNLLSYLRYDLGLTGSKYGCGEGLCGACTVLVDGTPLQACMSTVGAVIGGELTTIEGLAQYGRQSGGQNGDQNGDQPGELHPVQQAFIAEQAMQCGYCIPGFIMTTVGLLGREPHPSRGTIREALSEHICRCGAYQRIEKAVERAAGGES